MKRVLVVDDDVRLLAIVRKVLEGTQRYDVKTEDSARRALHVAEAFKPHLIILDVNMPGMGGVEFLRELSAPDGTLKYPVLVLTIRANMAGFFDDVAVAGFMAKPCDPDELRNEVDRIISLRGDQDDAIASEAVAAKQPKRILIGEDDEELAQILTDTLTRAGYTVQCVSQGPQVLEKAILHKPDAVLIKLVLTQLNGDAVARTLRDIPNTSGIPVILYNGSDYRPDESRLELPEANVRQYVKSDKSSDLLAAVEKITSR